MYKAVIFGIQGTKLTDEEKEFFKREKPIGFILFARNIENKTQLKSLVHDLRESVKNKNAPILIDQEGGRVARLKEPHWYHPPAARIFGDIAGKNIKDAKLACTLNAQILAHELIEMGINVDCAPLVDVPIKNANNVIGDRAFCHDPLIITELAESMIKGMDSKGVNHILKHIPGHGRSLLDSHFELPVIDTKLSTLMESDFIPFIKLNKSRWAMTAHIIYEDIDSFNPATHSKAVIKVIRNEINFKGILITDCITMQALREGPQVNAQKSFDAGCDLVLFSKPDLKDMKEISSISPTLTKTQLELIDKNPKTSSQESPEILFGKLNELLKIYGVKDLVYHQDPTDWNHGNA